MDNPLATPNPPGLVREPAADDAALAVEALLGDIVHVFREIRPGSEWPVVARAVLEHHDPPIERALLSPWHRVVQDRGRALLGALVTGHIGEIEREIKALTAVDGVRDLVREKDEAVIDLTVPD